MSSGSRLKLLSYMRCERRVQVDSCNDIVGDLAHVERPRVLNNDTVPRVDVIDSRCVHALAVVAIGGQNVVVDELDLGMKDIDGVGLLGQALAMTKPARPLGESAE